MHRQTPVGVMMLAMVLGGVGNGGLSMTEQDLDRMARDCAEISGDGCVLWKANVEELIALARANIARPVAGATADGVLVRFGDLLWSRFGGRPAVAGRGLPKKHIPAMYSTPEAAALAAAGARP